eukprot:80417_1
MGNSYLLGTKKLVALPPDFGLTVHPNKVTLGKVKAYLSHIPTEHLRQECRILDKIINNIIDNPYCAQYKSISIENLSKKICNNDIFFRILYCIGFAMSKDKKKLTINASNLESIKNWQHTFCETFIDTYDLQQTIKQKETIQQQINIFKRIDNLVGIYYKKSHINNYFNVQNEG